MSHTPPKWLVVDPSITFECAHEPYDDPEAAKNAAEAIAQRYPGEFVDVYQHLTSVRHTPDAD